MGKVDFKKLEKMPFYQVKWELLRYKEKPKETVKETKTQTELFKNAKKE